MTHIKRASGPNDFFQSATELNKIHSRRKKSGAGKMSDEETLERLSLEFVVDHSNLSAPRGILGSTRARHHEETKENRARSSQTARRNPLAGRASSSTARKS